MATRYSGNVRINLRYTDHDGQYHCNVVWTDGRKNVIVGHPAHLTMSVDSPEAYDRAAHAALSFVDNEPAYQRSGHFAPDYTDFGYAIRRGPVAGAGLRGFAGIDRGSAALIQSAFGVSNNGAHEVAGRLSRAAQNGDDADRTLKMMEGLLRSYRSTKLTHGVEAIIDPRKSFRGVYGQVAAFYLNTGDTYDTTLLYDVDKREYEITSWGDWLEQYENENGPIPG